MLKHCRPDILARGHLSLLHPHGHQDVIIYILDFWQKAPTDENKPYREKLDKNMAIPPSQSLSIWPQHWRRKSGIWWELASPPFYYLAPHRGRARYCNAHVCLCVCVCVCVFVCPCFRKISKCNISAISQPIIMKLGIHITYGYTVTDKYFQNFRSKVKVVGRRKVKNVIWPYLGNEWS